MWISIIALFHDVYEYIHHKIRLISYWIKGSSKYYLTYDGQVVPFRVPHSLIYCPVSKVIYSGDHKIAKRKRMPWLGLYLTWNENESLDLSDWISEMYTTSEYPSLLQIIRLASQTHNQHIPEIPTTEIHVVNKNGEDEMYEFTESILHVKTEKDIN